MEDGMNLSLTMGLGPTRQLGHCDQLRAVSVGSGSLADTMGKEQPSAEVTLWQISLELAFWCHLDIMKPIQGNRGSQMVTRDWFLVKLFEAFAFPVM